MTGFDNGLTKALDLVHLLPVPRRGLDGAVIVEVEASDDNEDLLDLAGQCAAEISNRGVAAQIDYLLGPSPA